METHVSCHATCRDGTCARPGPARRMILRGPTAGRSARVALADLLDGILRANPDDKVVVFAQRPETVAAIAARVESKQVNGGGSAKQRQPGHSAVTVGILLCPGLNGTELKHELS